MTSSYYITLVIVFSALAGLLFLMLKLSKKVYLKRYSGDIKVTDRIPIDSNVSLMIREVKGKSLLMSVANKDVKLLMEIQ